ncbi:hypothetical protein N658DRAFT_563606 [Parathielavia hyrcaniae]|uniref:Aminoglycoside phosphotransferase domain-containing protein n=1 Tax=Parathielavia hyrcaniae TaxID=113614 RepID=A0AAN6T7H2_9PEZI|nr:hypothetical protein N658DRAFT_563606 [Parathielavia hyrcaniae]
MASTPPKTAPTDHVTHVRDCVRQLDGISWLIGCTRLLRCVKGPPPIPTPDGGPLPPDGHVRQIHDAGDASAVLSFGNELIVQVRVAEEITRREHETIAFLLEKPLSFDIPKVLFYTEEKFKVYLIEPFVPGKRLNEAGWDMAEQEKAHVVTRVAGIAAELAAFRPDEFTWADANWLDPFQERPRNRNPPALQNHCESLGMDCSIFVLPDNDLGPTSIVVNGDRIAVLSWEMAGYAPLAWVRTKFAICGALEVERVGGAGLETNPEYRVRVEKKLGEMGFTEVTAAYKKMANERLIEWQKKHPWTRMQGYQ